MDICVRISILTYIGLLLAKSSDKWCIISMICLHWVTMWKKISYNIWCTSAMLYFTNDRQFLCSLQLKGVLTQLGSGLCSSDFFPYIFHLHYISTPRTAMQRQCDSFSRFFLLYRVTHVDYKITWSHSSVISSASQSRFIDTAPGSTSDDVF